MARVVDIKVRFNIPDNMDEDLVSAAIVEYVQDDMNEMPHRIISDFGVKTEMELVHNISEV